MELQTALWWSAGRGLTVSRFQNILLRYSELTIKYSISLNALMWHGILDIEFYDGQANKFRNIAEISKFSEQFWKKKKKKKKKMLNVKKE